MKNLFSPMAQLEDGLKYLMNENYELRRRMRPGAPDMRLNIHSVCYYH